MLSIKRIACAPGSESLKISVGKIGLATLALGLSFSAFGCAGTQKSNVEAAPSPTTVEARQQQMAKLPPPELAQAQQAVDRVFKSGAVIDVSQQPSFVAGDFNGDLSQDLVVIVKPASGKLEVINEDFPAWILRDISQTTEQGGPPARVVENEVLLAIIHGYGSDGWRDPQATQSYLLKNAAGTGLGVQTGKEFIAVNTGKPLPRLHGDLIKQTIRGTTGFLYYAGPTYSWYDPKTFKEEFSRRLVHERAAMKR
jgi:hypothetical protein